MGKQLCKAVNTTGEPCRRPAEWKLYRQYDYCPHHLREREAQKKEVAA